jgi:hypothetical protein
MQFSGSASVETVVSSGPALMRLPELIAALASEGEVLRWDSPNEWYEVIDGPRFEERFNALRCRRERRKEESVYRPFARMPTYFTLMRGEKWAGTGTAFRPRMKTGDVLTQAISDVKVMQPMQQQQLKKAPRSMSHSPVPMPAGGNVHDVDEASSHGKAMHSIGATSPALMNADKISVTLHGVPNDASGHFRCSLQHFLDVTGAGDLYNRSVAGGAGMAGRLSDPLAGSASQSSYGSEAASSDWSSAGSPDTDHSGAETVARSGANGMMLQDDDIAGIVGGLWDESSLGDQAYFFPRRPGQTPFCNGAIVTLIDGCLSSGPPAANERVMYMVVSDNNAKWKGEPLPTPEEERLGHWCAFLGQVRARAAECFAMGEMIEKKYVERG